MKKLVKTLLVCGFASAMVEANAFAQPFTFTFDEYGNGSFPSEVPSPIAIPSAISVDPISGQEALCYDLTALEQLLGFAFVSGDVLLYEQGATDPSDLIRFVQTPTFGAIYFFSAFDADDMVPFYPYYMGPSLADVDQLPNPVTPNVSVAEIGGSATWRPVVPGPGYVAVAPGVIIYHLVSDYILVPEPSTLALVGLGGGLLALVWRNRSQRA